MDKFVYIWDLNRNSARPFLTPMLTLAISKSDPHYDNHGALTFNGDHLVIGGRNAVTIISMHKLRPWFSMHKFLDIVQLMR